MTRNGGAWTLLVTSSSQQGWTGSTLKQRNPDKPSLNTDYSILGVSDLITDSEEFQVGTASQHIDPSTLSMVGTLFDP